MAPGHIRIHSDPLAPKWVITVAICKGHGPLSASNDASLRESAAKQQGTLGAVPYPSTGRTEYRCREKKKATTTVQCCTQSKATPTEPCNATARSQASAAFHAQRLQRSASTDTAHAFLLVHLSCQQRKHSFALVPSAKRPPLPLNDPMHQYLQPSTGSRCPPLPYPWPGLRALL